MRNYIIEYKNGLKDVYEVKDTKNELSVYKHVRDIVYKHNESVDWDKEKIARIKVEKIKKDTQDELPF